MNKKADILNHIRSAKAAHLRWKAHATALVEGLPLEDGQIPILHTDCIFGKWYYGSGQILNSLNSYASLDEPHEQLHKIYMKIFKLLFGDQDKSMFSKLFGAKAKTQQNHAEAKTMMRVLSSISVDMVEKLNRLEKDILAMSDEQIEALI